MVSVHPSTVQGEAYFLLEIYWGEFATLNNLKGDFKTRANLHSRMIIQGGPIYLCVKKV